MYDIYLNGVLWDSNLSSLHDAFNSANLYNFVYNTCDSSEVVICIILHELAYSKCRDVKTVGINVYT